MAPSRTSPTRVAVVGLGYWGPNLLRVLAEQPDAELAWICDLDRDRLSAYRRRYPEARVDHAARAGARRPERRRGRHRHARCIRTTSWPRRRSRRGSTRSSRSRSRRRASSPIDLVELARDRPTASSCAVTRSSTARRSAPSSGCSSRARSATIYFISSSRVNLGLHQRDVSVIWDLGPHDFSILLYWLGETPDHVRAVGRDSIVKGIADVAFVTMSFASGDHRQRRASWLAPSKLRRTVLVGSERMVIYDDGAREPVRVFDRGVVYRDPETFGEYHLSYRSGDILSPKIESYEPLSLQLSDFLGAITSGSRMNYHTAMARSVVRMIEAADHSLALGGDAVALDHSDVAESLNDPKGVLLA